MYQQTMMWRSFENRQQAKLRMYRIIGTLKQHTYRSNYSIKSGGEPIHYKNLIVIPAYAIVLWCLRRLGKTILLLHFRRYLITCQLLTRLNSREKASSVHTYYKRLPIRSKYSSYNKYNFGHVIKEHIKLGSHCPLLMCI